MWKSFSEFFTRDVAELTTKTLPVLAFALFFKLANVRTKGCYGMVVDDVYRSWLDITFIFSPI